jgi:hypothetical protein
MMEDDYPYLEAEAHFEMERHKEQDAEEKCDHKWKYGQTPSTPDSPPEGYEYCELCGMERPGSFVE